MSKLDTLVKKLGEAYDKYKEAEKGLGTSKKPGIKQEFFNEATEASSSTLAQRTFAVDAESAAAAQLEAEKRFPRFRVVSVDGEKDFWRVLLEEDPAYKDFTYVDKENKRVWTKQVVDGSPYLDDEALREKDPELWRRVSTIDNIDFIRNALYEGGVDHLEIDDHIAKMEEHYEAKRTMRPLDELDPEDVAAVQSYIYLGKPVVKLAAPRKAKSEELEEEDA